MASRVTDLRDVEGAYAALDDRMLVLDFQAGNGHGDAAYREIYHRYSGLARHVCRRMLGNAEEAEEASQETMVRVLQGLERFNGRYALQPWVARIATNVSLDILRTRSRRPQISDTPLSEVRAAGDSDVLDPDAVVDRLLEQERVNRILAELPSHHRDALVLREYEGLSHEEIGRALGMSASQVKALIHRAKGSFRRAWDKERYGRGIAALVPILLAPLRLSQAIRRIFHPVSELATSTASTAASSPAVAGASSGVTAAERITAAAVTVLIAGTAAVGAVTLKHPHSATVLPAPVPVTSPAPAPALTPPAPTRPVPDHRHHERSKGVVRGSLPAVDTPIAPVATPAPTTAPVPSTEPTVSPSVDPSPTVAPPPVPPAPAWSLGFGTSIAHDGAACDCPETSVLSSSISGTTADGLTFAQVVRGAATDAAGAPAWPLSLQYWGSTGTPGSMDGRVDVSFVLSTEEGNYAYQGMGVLAEVTTSDGGTAYRFAGSYRLVRVPGDTIGNVPVGGELSATLEVWSDGSTLFSSRFMLYDV